MIKINLKTLTINIVLIFVSTVATLFAAELIVRLAYKDVTTTGDNSSYYAIRWRKSYASHLNSFGYREREISTSKDTETYRIVVIGDSLTYGQGISIHERFTNLLEAELNKYGKIYEVLNFGKPGAETYDHIGLLDTVYQLDPDFILMQWFTNDVEGKDKSARPQPYRLIPSDYITGMLQSNSALYYLIKTKYHALQGSLGLIKTYEQSMHERFRDANSEESQRARHELDEFISRVAFKNIPLGIVLFPRLIETNGNIEHYQFGYLFERVIEACRRHSIACLDLRPAFAEITPITKLWASRLDPHPGPLANKIAAENILETFKKAW